MKTCRKQVREDTPSVCERYKDNNNDAWGVGVGVGRFKGKLVRLNQVLKKTQILKKEREMYLTK